MKKEYLDIILLLAMVIATFIDCKKREIPTGIFPACAVAYVGWHYVEGDLYAWWQGAAICAGITFLIYCVLACFGICGGGDVIMMSCLAVIFNYSSMTIIILLSGLLSLFLALITKIKKSVPFSEIDIPYTLPVTISTISMFLLQFYKIGGIQI